LTFRNLQTYFELKEQYPIIEDAKKKLAKIETQLETIIQRLTDPQRYKNDLTKKLEENKEDQEKVSSDLEEKKKEFITIQGQLSQKVSSFLSKYNEVIVSSQDYAELLDSRVTTYDLKNYLITYEDNKIAYVGIKKEILDLKQFFKIPSEPSDSLAMSITIKNSQLSAYEDVPEDTPTSFDQMKNTIGSYEKELENYSKECDRCDKNYTEAHETLQDRLDKWKKDINMNFGKVMRTLGLDGDLFFEDLDGEGNYGLTFNVANSVGGAKSLIEKSNFSGGEKQRTCIAFLVSIIVQTQYTYLVWDEPDSAVGEPQRELIANVIQTYFPYRKLIMASPQRIVKGYLKVFDKICEVYRDKEGSHISKARFTDEYRKDKGVLNV